MKFSIPFRPSVAASSMAFCSSIFGNLINSTAIFAFSFSLGLSECHGNGRAKEQILEEDLKRKSKI